MDVSSLEAMRQKTLGIPMGAPAFKYLNLFKKKQVNVFSSNYPLYGDMSQRVMKILSMHTPNIEIYSIDEAFLDFRGFKYCDLEKEGLLLKQKIKRWTGIPVSIGIAPTKALAKIANKIAKKYVHKTKGVYLIKSEKQISNALKWTKVEDIWGVGRQYKKLLVKNGVVTANDFCKLPDQWVKKYEYPRSSIKERFERRFLYRSRRRKPRQKINCNY